MPIFRVETRDGAIRLTVAAACITCARNVAAENAKGEGPAVWRDNSRSKVTMSDPKPTNRAEVLTRSESGD